jgi:hypothetical protein
VLRERGVKLRRSGAELTGPCPHCGGRDRFGVNLRKQVFLCRACGARGSVIDLVALLDRCAIREAVAKLCGNPPPGRPNPERVYSRTPTDCDGTTRALQWRAEARSIAGTLAEDYLVQHRGIGTFPPDIDEVLRFHPRCIFGADQFYPCLLALVRNIVTDEPQAIIRTALATTAEKIGRMALGPTANGAIKLWADDCVTTGLVIGEGAETCLAAASMSHRGTLLQPIWSLIDAGHVEQFPILAGVEALTILVDHDKPDQHGRHAGQHATQQCAKRWLAAGCEVEVLMPSAIGADFNNVALARTQ